MKAEKGKDQGRRRWWSDPFARDEVTAQLGCIWFPLALPILAALVVFLFRPFGSKVPVVVVNHCGDDAAPGFRFEKVPAPRRQDAAAKATFSLIDGRPDANGAGLEALHDGLLPTEEDEPPANFFFRAGSRGGRIGVDLGAALEVGAVNTYSWHPGGRGPQVYTLYGSAGTNAGFVAAPARPGGANPPTVRRPGPVVRAAEPAACQAGWKQAQRRAPVMPFGQALAPHKQRGALRPSRLPPLAGAGPGKKGAVPRSGYQRWD